MVAEINALPEKIPNWIGGRETESEAGTYLSKKSPVTGKVLVQLAASGLTEIDRAVQSANSSQKIWSEVTPVDRGKILFHACQLMEEQKNRIAEIVSLETGKSVNDALGETDAAISVGRFFAGEGQRLYARTTTSGVAGKTAMTIRKPCGVAALIISANTPIANIAWKVFPALICGNGVVLKASEDAPATAWIFSVILHKTSLPDGVFNVVNGAGEDAGAALVKHPGIDVLSFTGSTAVGKWIAAQSADRLLKISLELGGKNPFVVCEDAELKKAAKWAALSAFSNAGQRCASGSRIIVEDKIYEEFESELLGLIEGLTIGPDNTDDLGPVINEVQLLDMIKAIDEAVGRGAKILHGGRRMSGGNYADGYYLEPTLLENVPEDDELSQSELFGPIACLYRVKDYTHALEMANNSRYGLTACIHTKNIDRAMHFIRNSRTGVVVVNAGTYGSEPHMPFGGLKESGNGTREPGTEAIDIYTELTDVYIQTDAV